MRKAIRKAVKDLEPQLEAAKQSRQKSVKFFDIIRQAQRNYCEGLTSEESQPSVNIFSRLLIGKKSDRELVQLLEAAGVEKQGNIDKDKLKQSVLKILKTFEAQLETARKPGGKPILFSVFVRQVYQEYCNGLAVDEYKPRTELMHIFMGETADPELVRLLENAGLQKRGPLDKGKVREAILESIKILKSQIESVQKPSKKVPFSSVVKLAHSLFCEKLAPGEYKPSQRAFDIRLLGKMADMELVRFIEEAGIVKKGLR